MIQFNHKPGACFVDYNRRICFVCIPKNASTSFREMLVNRLHFKEGSTLDDDFTSFFTFTVVRHPALRLISGLHEFMDRNSITKSSVEVFREIYTDRDEHLEPQTSFMKGVKFNLLIRQERSVEGISYLTSKTGLVINKVPYKNMKTWPDNYLEILFNSFTVKDFRKADTFYTHDYSMYFNPKSFLKREGVVI